MQGHGPHSRYRIIIEFNLETEDGDCFPATDGIPLATCSALEERANRLVADLGEIGAVAVYGSVSVEHGGR